MDELLPRLFERALQIAGGQARLRALLDVEDHALAMWLSHRARPPQNVFLKLVDLVLEDDLARASQDRRREPRTDIVPLDTSV